LYGDNHLQEGILDVLIVHPETIGQGDVTWITDLCPISRIDQGERGEKDGHNELTQKLTQYNFELTTNSSNKLPDIILQGKTAR
jgi:hypothetical protein